jgi:hypothetical protein
LLCLLLVPLFHLLFFRLIGLLQVVRLELRRV